MNDTIVAVGSGSGAAARAVIRLSGASARSAASEVFAPRASVEGATRRCAIDGELRLPGVASACPAVAYVFVEPRSYTREDLVELHVPGAPPLVEALVAALLTRGARLARPGEMTRRAFESGRIDLARAEAIAELIQATGASEHRAALATLEGGLSLRVAAARDELLDLLAYLEAELDFAEEDIDLMPARQIDEHLGRGEAMVLALAARVRASGGRPAEPLVLLVGAPNAGKSSLFNALLGEEAAVVTGEPGTTLDRNERLLTRGDVRLRLADVAGIAEPRGRLEERAQALVRQLVLEADHVLLVTPVDEERGVEPPELEGKVVTRVRSKCDLPHQPREGERLVSSVTGEGVGELADHLVALAAGGAMVVGGEALAVGAHAADCLRHAADALAEGRNALAEGRELVAEELRAAVDALGELLGLRVTEEVVDRIFSSFCIGK